MIFKVMQTKLTGVIDRRMRILPVFSPIFPEAQVKNVPIPFSSVRSIRFHYI